MTTSGTSDFPTFSSARQNAELSDSAGFVPQMSTQPVSSVMSASTVQPKVSTSIQMRGFQHIWPMPMLLGEPNSVMNRCSGQNEVCGPPIMDARVPGPCSARSASKRLAISSRASSQLTRSHWPLPRSPTRLSGWFTRSAPSSTSRFMGHRRQPASICGS